MNKLEILSIIQSLIEIECYHTAQAMWKVYLEM